MIIGWLVIIGLMAWGVTAFSQRSGSNPQRQDPLDIAKERYTRGEITKEQFEQIKKDLTR
jgi:putative membrane protein